MVDQTTEVELNEATEGMQEWIENDEGLYLWVRECARRIWNRTSDVDRAVNKLADEVKIELTRVWEDPASADNSWVQVFKQLKLEISDIDWEELVRPQIDQLVEEEKGE